MFSVWELSLPRPWSRYYGAHLRPQATRGKQVPTAAAAPRRSFRPEPSPLPTSESLVRRKAALRAEQRRGRAALAPGVRVGGRPGVDEADGRSGCHRASCQATGRSRTNSTRAGP